MNRIALFALLGLLFFPGEGVCREITLTVVYNNMPGEKGFGCSWGFSCLVEGLEKTILFDAGRDGSLLLKNMDRARIDPARITTLFLSHAHNDHTGGVEALLTKNPFMEIVCPGTFPETMKSEFKRRCKALVEVDGPLGICRNAWTTGVLGMDVKEQALVLESGKGLVIITGCAHPGIVKMVEFAKTHFNRNVYLVMGGFHLQGSDGDRTMRIIRRLKNIGVEKVGPSHCTGELALKAFREEWGKDFIHLGCGEKFTLAD